MLSVFNPMKGADRIVYGMGVSRIDAFGPPLFGHMGDGPGHGSIAMFDPANGVTVVVLTNIGMAEAQVEPFIEVMNVLTGGNVSTR
jgi:CubicO group peptidase (beta-lactamase class C family)